MNRERRLALKLLGGFGGVALTGAWLLQQPTTQPSVIAYGAATLANGVFTLASVNLRTLEQVIIPLPFQGHGLVALDSERVLLFGRRPGTQSAFIHPHTQAISSFATPEGRHFNGHGCLSEDGSTLFTTENDYQHTLGIIGLRDAHTGQLIGEYESGGLDPHDIKLMPDGKTLVIANGGIATHPDFDVGRRKLNIATMQPNLVYLDSHSGKVLAEYRLPDHQLSIRHLALTAQGDVAAALQYEGKLARTPPASLVALQASGGEFQLLPTPAELMPKFLGYMGDLSFTPQQDYLLVTSQRGQHLGCWDMKTQQFHTLITLPEPNGIATHPDLGLWVSSSAGSFAALNDLTYQPQLIDLKNPLSWDNHLIIKA